jgi:hypothetical protein
LDREIESADDTCRAAVVIGDHQSLDVEAVPIPS